MIRFSVCLLCFAGVLVAQTSAPERKVEQNAVVSPRDPNVRVQFPPAALYVGGNRWNLYDIADCELHVFVDADSQENVQRLYWVQFEGYLPSKPDLAHQYASLRHPSGGGLDFYVDTWVRAKGDAARLRPSARRCTAAFQGIQDAGRDDGRPPGAFAR